MALSKARKSREVEMPGWILSWMLSALTVLFAIGDSRLWKRTGCSGLLLQPACLNFAPLSPLRQMQSEANWNFTPFRLFCIPAIFYQGKFLPGLDFLTYQEEVCGGGGCPTVSAWRQRGGVVPRSDYHILQGESREPAIHKLSPFSLD